MKELSDSAVERTGPARTRCRYLPFNLVTPGMILGEAVLLADRGVVRFRLPEGTELSEESLAQMARLRADFVCIALPDPRGDDEVAVDTAAAAAQVMRIFEGADLSQPAMAALFNRILVYRSR